VLLACNTFLNLLSKKIIYSKIERKKENFNLKNNIYFHKLERNKSKSPKNETLKGILSKLNTQNMKNGTFFDMQSIERGQKIDKKLI
jgi:hypothetical protein